MRVVLGLGVVIAAGLLACSGEGEPEYSQECIALWNDEVELCWNRYCTLDPGRNRLFCSCLTAQQSLDGATCGCSGLAEDSFLDACSAQEPPVRFDCAEDMKRLAELSARWKCCLEAADCGGGTCGEDNRCQ